MKKAHPEDWKTFQFPKKGDGRLKESTKEARRKGFDLFLQELLNVEEGYGLQELSSVGWLDSAVDSDSVRISSSLLFLHMAACIKVLPHSLTTPFKMLQSPTEPLSPQGVEGEDSLSLDSEPALTTNNDNGNVNDINNSNASEGSDGGGSGKGRGQAGGGAELGSDVHGSIFGGPSANVEADTTERQISSGKGGGGWFGAGRYALIEQRRTDKGELEKLRGEKLEWTAEKAKLEKRLVKLKRIEVRSQEGGAAESNDEGELAAWAALKKQNAVCRIFKKQLAEIAAELEAEKESRGATESEAKGEVAALKKRLAEMAVKPRLQLSLYQRFQLAEKLEAEKHAKAAETQELTTALEQAKAAELTTAVVAQRAELEKRLVKLKRIEVRSQEEILM